MNTVRLNITLPADVSRKLDELVAPRKKSRFIADAIRGKLDQIQREQLRRDLAEGYQATRQESLNSSSDFEMLDLEG